MRITAMTGSSNHREAPCRLLVKTADGRTALEGMHRLFPGSKEMLLQVKIIVEAVLRSKGGRSDPAGSFLSLAREKDRSAIAPCFCVLLLSRQQEPYSFTYLIGALVAAAIAAFHGVASGNPHLSPYHYPGCGGSWFFHQKAAAVHGECWGYLVQDFRKHL